MVSELAEDSGGDSDDGQEDAKMTEESMARSDDQGMLVMT